MSDARTRAIDAMSKAAWIDQQGLAYWVNAGEMLDAVPDQVLADLLIERGALTSIAWVSGDGIHNLRRKRSGGHSHDTIQVRTDRRDDYNTITLYRLTPKDPG